MTRRELTLVDAAMLNMALKQILGNEISPVKKPLICTMEELDTVLKAANNNKNSIFEKYIIKGEDGKPVLKEDLKEPTGMVTDYQLTDSEALTKELGELSEKTVSIGFDQITKEDTVLIKVSGEYREMTLEDYLEKATDIKPNVVALLNEYYIA